MRIQHAQFGHTTSEQDKEHDDALLTAQLSLLAKVAQQEDSNKARRFAEAYALITGKLAAPIGEVPKA